MFMLFIQVSMIEVRSILGPTGELWEGMKASWTGLPYSPLAMIPGACSPSIMAGCSQAILVGMNQHQSECYN